MNLKNFAPRFSHFWKVVGCFLLIHTAAEAAFIPIGAGGYTTDLPPGRVGPSNQNNEPVNPKKGPAFNKPVQTNDWWSSLIWTYNPTKPWSENLFAHPLSFKAVATGLEIGYPTKYSVNPYNTGSQGHKTQEYHYGHTRDLLAGIVGLNSPDTKVNDYSDWTVTAYWANNAANTMEATIGEGLPFVYVTKNGGDALVTLSGTPTIWSNANGVVGVTINNHHYGIFAPTGSNWVKNGNTLQSNLNGKNYYSIGLLPDNQPSTLEFFRQHAYAFVTNTQVEWTYDKAHSVVKAIYRAQTTLKEPGPGNSNVNRPLMALRRHHWLNSTDPLLGFTYSSAHGTMKVVDASQFTTEMVYNGSLPFLPNFAQEGVDSYNLSQLYTYIDTIYKQTPTQRWQSTGAGTDTYWMGKALARIAHLIPIAEQVKHGAARDLFIAELKVRLQNWLDGKDSQLFYYSSNWNSLIGYPASYGSDKHLSDHHFHYGYFIIAAAMVATYDPAWASANQWGGMIDMLVKDVANWDRNNTQFPFLRNFDVYAGHGWASGNAGFGAGNNEESSSEEINFISGLIQWGSLTGNDQIRDLGVYLYTTIVSAIPQYWFDVDNEVFPPDFQPITLGINWSNGGAYAIWWAGKVQELHGINFLPIQPGMLYLSKYPDYLQANQDFMLANNGTFHTDVWRDIHMSVKALYNPIAAISEFNNNLSYNSESGDSKAHTYHWIHNLNQLGKLDPSITADIATYAVFTKNGVRNHVAFNPNPLPIVVTFSDGVTLTVPARTIATNNQTPNPHSFTHQTEDLGEVSFYFNPNWTTQSVKLIYRINGGAQKTVTMVKKSDIWKYTISGLKEGYTIDYTYLYEDNGSEVSSAPNQHIYHCDSNSHVFTQQAEDLGEVSFSFTPDWATQYVKLIYRINGGAQKTVTMVKKSDIWKYTISGLKEGYTIDYTYLYEDNGGEVSSAPNQHIYHCTGIST